MSDWVDIDALATMRGRLTDYLTRGESIPNVFAAMGAMHPQIERIAKYLYLSESIYEASGIELDRFGEYVDIARQGRSDSDYRQAILFKKQSQSFSGTIDELLQLLSSQANTDSIIITERKSAAINFHISDNVLVNNETVKLLKSSSAAGVKTTITIGRGQKSFFFAGVKSGVLAIGVEGGKILSTKDRKGFGVITKRQFAFNNLSGLLVTPDILSTKGGAIGVNGRALALNKFSSKSTIANDGIRLAGAY